MPPRFLLDVAAGAEKDEVHTTTSCLTFDRPGMIQINAVNIVV
jgi:hypothetical protein